MGACPNTCKNLTPNTQILKKRVWNNPHPLLVSLLCRVRHKVSDNLLNLFRELSKIWCLVGRIIQTYGCPTEGCAPLLIGSLADYYRVQRTDYGYLTSHAGIVVISVSYRGKQTAYLVQNGGSNSGLFAHLYGCAGHRLPRRRTYSRRPPSSAVISTVEHDNSLHKLTAVWCRVAEKEQILLLGCIAKSNEVTLIQRETMSEKDWCKFFCHSCKCLVVGFEH